MRCSAGPDPSGPAVNLRSLNSRATQQAKSLTRRASCHSLDGRHCRSCRKAPHLYAAGKGVTPTDRRVAFPSPPTDGLGCLVGERHGRRGRLQSFGGLRLLSSNSKHS